MHRTIAVLLLTSVYFPLNSWCIEASTVSKWKLPDDSIQVSECSNVQVQALAKKLTKRNQLNQEFWRIQNNLVDGLQKDLTSRRIESAISLTSFGAAVVCGTIAAVHGLGTLSGEGVAVSRLAPAAARAFSNHPYSARAVAAARAAAAAAAKEAQNQRFIGSVNYTIGNFFSAAVIIGAGGLVIELPAKIKETIRNNSPSSLNQQVQLNAMNELDDTFSHLHAQLDKERATAMHEVNYDRSKNAESLLLRTFSDFGLTDLKEMNVMFAHAVGERDLYALDMQVTHDLVQGLITACNTEQGEITPETLVNKPMESAK